LRGGTEVRLGDHDKPLLLEAAWNAWLLQENSKNKRAGELDHQNDSNHLGIKFIFSNTENRLERKKGSLLKKGGKLNKWKVRHAELTDIALNYYTTPHDLCPRGTIYLRKITDIHAGDLMNIKINKKVYKFSFVLICGSTKVVLVTELEKDMQEWVNEIARLQSNLPVPHTDTSYVSYLRIDNTPVGISTPSSVPLPAPLSSKDTKEQKKKAFMRKKSDPTNSSGTK